MIGLALYYLLTLYSIAVSFVSVSSMAIAITMYRKVKIMYEERGLYGAIHSSINTVILLYCSSHRALLGDWTGE